MSSRYTSPRASWRTPLFAALALLLSLPTASAQDASRRSGPALQASAQTAPLLRGGGAIQDGSFEAGSPNPFWDEASAQFGSPICSPALCGVDGAEDGTFFVWMGGTGTGPGAETSSVSQEVSVAAGTYTMTYYVNAAFVDDNSDFEFSVEIDGESIFELDEDLQDGAFPTDEYVELTETLTFDAPTTFTLLVDYTQSANASVFFDNVSLAAPPTPDQVTFSPDPVTATAMTNMTTSATVTLTNTGNEAVDFSVVGFDEDGGRLSAEALRTIANAPARRETAWPQLDLGKYDADPRKGDPVRYGAGGPDSFGYTWIDSNEPGGPDFDFVDISSTGTLLTFSGTDDGAASVTLPFGFSFYGETKTTALVSTNGYLTFGGDGTDFSNDPIPNTTDPNDFIAPFWDDLEVNATAHPGSGAWAQDMGDGRFIVQWRNTRLGDPAGSAPTLSFQAVLFSSGEIRFQYQQVSSTTLNSATIGTENADASAGLQVAFNQAYVEAGLAVLITNVPQFVSDVTPDSGTIPAGGSVTLSIDFEAQPVGGTYEAILTVETDANDLGIPLVYVVTGTPVIGLSAADLDLGDITQGFPSTATLTIFNTGDDVLTVTDITSSDDAFSTSFDDDLVIAAGDSATVTVTFDPDTPGDFAGTLTVVSDGGTATVNVTGTANSAGDIAVTPDTVQATVEAGETTTASFTIANEGVGNLIFTIPGFEDEDPARAAQMTARYEAQFGRAAGTLSPQKGAPDLRTGGLGRYLRAGGPDAFGYTFVDSNEPNGPSYNFVDISGTGTALGLGDDEGSGALALPFSFPFYGEQYDEVYVNSNGWLSVVDPGAAAAGGASRNNTMLPTPAAPNGLIAVLWDDLNPGEAAADDVYVQNMGDGRFIVQWNEVPTFSGAGGNPPLTFQAILSASGQILLQYESIAGTITATAGIENVDGTDGLEASFNESGYLQDGLAIRFSATAPFVTDVDPDSGTLAPGESVEVTLTLSAEGLFAGVYEGSITIESNDADETPLAVPIVLTVTGQPEISLDVDGVADGDSLGFGAAIPGDEVLRTVTVRNVGTDALTVDAAITKGIGQNNAFSFVSGAIGPIAPGDSAEIVIAFEPDEQGEFTASLVIESDDADEGEIEIDLFGTGLVPPAASVDPDEIDLLLDLNGAPDQLTTSFTLSNASPTPLEFSVRANLDRDDDAAPATGPTRTATSTGTALALFASTAGAEAMPSVDAARADPGDVIDQVAFQTATSPLGITMSDEGTIYVADISNGQTETFDADLNRIGSFANPTLPGGVTLGVAYNPGTETLWYTNIVQDGSGNTAQAQIAEATLSGAATGTVIQIPTNGGQVIPAGLEFDPVTGTFFYIDIRADDIYSLDLNGTVVAGYPVPQTSEDAGQGLFGNGLDVYGGTLEVLVGVVNVDDGANRIVRTDLMGNTIATEITGLIASTGDDFINDLVRSRVAPNEVIYLVGNATGTLFAIEADERDDLGNVAVSPDMGTLGDGESVEITLTIDTAGLEIGSYSGEVVILTNDPSNPTLTIPISLEVIDSTAGEEGAELTVFTLQPVFPNPVGATGTVRYGLPAPSEVSLRLYDVTGRLVATLVKAEKAAGWHDAPLDAGQLAPGVYVVSIQAGSFSATQKLTVVR